ncbi:MAG: pyridoxal phosphate-dependent aminotransferase [Planctomycetota bacterium]
MGQATEPLGRRAGSKKASKNAISIQLGFSGAGNPGGSTLREYGSGHPELQAKLAGRFGVPRDHVYLVGGTSLANFISIAAFSDPGELVAVELPRYAPLAEVPRALGCEIADVLVHPDGLGPIPKEARLAVVTSPHNPTGRALADRDWKALARFANRGGVVVVDEVYTELQRKRTAVAATRHPRFLTTGSFTKTHGLGGLRLGWVLGHPDLLEPIRRVDNLVSVQVATPSILKLLTVWPRLGEWRKKNMRHVATNLRTLRAAGLSFPDPDGGLTALVDVGNGDAVSDELERRGVGVARGSYFGAPYGIRMFLGADPAVFKKGVAAICEVVEARRDQDDR